MNKRYEQEFGERRRRSIHIGGVCASGDATVVRTILGSCIAVGLYDPTANVGGLNHFMLPESSSGEAVSARYGVHAMELLINDCMRHGADRRRLQAKVFGGAHVLRIAESAEGVPQSNIRFALNFLETEEIPVVSRDLGGYAAREVYFFTDTGRALLRRLESTGSDQQALAAEMAREKKIADRPAPQPSPSDDSNITLF
ncbi:MAG: chemotaxis protein CheD [Capsulimonas sp.]|uniref:chemotaxis protein CheD n=1 Tax=Capsulimonas sp. TaxID=2494211 RepID=UPI003262CFB1